MKVYRRSEFMKLPAGVIYAKGKPWYFESLSVKGDSLESDFIEMSLVDIDAHDSGEWGKRLEQMLETGCSYPMRTDCYGRDGCFDDEEIFLVYEVVDLEKLRDIIDSAITVSKGEK